MGPTKKTNLKIFKGIKNQIDKMEREIKNDVFVPVAASFGFIIALIWRDAIKATLDEYLSRAGLLEDAYIYQIISAIIITIVVIFIMIIITKIGRKKKKIKKILGEKINELKENK